MSTGWWIPGVWGKALLANAVWVTSTFWLRVWGQVHLFSTHIKKGAERSEGKCSFPPGSLRPGVMPPHYGVVLEAVWHSQGTHRAHLSDLGLELPLSVSEAYVAVLHTSSWAHSYLRTFLGYLVSGGGFELGCRSDPLQELAHTLPSSHVSGFFISALCSFRCLPWGMDSGAGSISH